MRKYIAPDPAERPYTRAATSVFWLCFLVYSFSYIGRQNFSACLPAMIRDGTITKLWGGSISTAYLIAYASGQLINGIIGSRIRPLYMITVGLCGAGLCNIGMGLCDLPILFLLLWLCNGLFQSMLWSPIVRVFTDYLNEGQRYRAGVNIAPAIPVGTVLAYLLPALLLERIGWRGVFFTSGGLLLLACAVWVLGNHSLRARLAVMAERVRAARPTPHTETIPADTAAPAPKRPSLPAVLLASGLIPVLFCLACNGALKDAVNSWAPTFFQERFGISEANAALVSVIIPVVSVSGAYVSTWINKRFLHNELYSSGVMFLIALLSVGGIYLTRERGAVLCACFLAVSISSMWGASTMFLTMLPYHFAGLGLSSAVSGFLNAGAYAASAICTSLYGLAAEHAGWDTLIFIWLGIGLLGALACLMVGRLWGKKAGQLDEGTLF